MRSILPEALVRLAQTCSFPLYVVGGSVRDFLAGRLSPLPDYDLCAAVEEERLIEAAKACGFTVKSVYRATGTVKLAEGENAYEFTRFRSDRYVRGFHAPAETEFTNDVGCDARRRDFCANAVYYDVAGGRYLDPLGGIGDIEKKRLRTVAPAKKVFGEDGLRLMRLARIAAQTGFTPDGEALAGARENCALIGDIAPERIYAELQLILHADGKGGADAPYRGLSLLRETGVLERLMPELTRGDPLPQRSDFHDHTVLEHSLRCVRYAPPEIRWAALLHDVGKPFCFFRDGNFHAHPAEGARIAREILCRLKAPKRLTEETERLVRLHMRDYNLAMKETKVRLDIVKAGALLNRLLALKQADFSACKDELSPAPAVLKWERILAEMKAEGAPVRLSELAVKGDDLAALGLRREKIGGVLSLLLHDAALNGALNTRERLLRRARTLAEQIDS